MFAQCMKVGFSIPYPPHFDNSTFLGLICYFFVKSQHLLKDFSKINQIKGLKLKNKGHMNFYECCDLTKKVCLKCVLLLRISSVFYHQVTGALFSSTPLRKQEQLEHTEQWLWHHRARLEKKFVWWIPLIMSDHGRLVFLRRLLPQLLSSLHNLY